MRAAFVGEVLGTFLLVLFGTGSVACAVLTGALQGLWQVAVVWGFGVALAIYCSAALSGAHLNPAVSLAFALWRADRFPRGRLVPYWLAQLLGAVAAGATVWLAFGPFLARFEAREGLIRGTAGSERAAMVFGEYFPNPAVFGTGPDAAALVSPVGAMLVEAFGTGILVLVIFALTDPDNAAAPPRGLVPFFVGFTVAALISLFAPITQAGWNPARDFGPRLVALAAGYGEIALPGPRGGFWIYVVGPLLGGPLGGLLYEGGMRPLLRRGVPARVGSCATGRAGGSTNSRGDQGMSLFDVELEFALKREVARLSDEFRGIFGQETIDRYVRESLTGLQGAQIRAFLPVFTYRFARERLKALAQSRGVLVKDRPEILFVCVHNAGRSQMAAALTAALGGGRVNVRSAGSEPADRINPAVVEAMAELGLDLSQEFPKPLTDEFVRAADVVVTMGCGDACPIYPGKRYEDWELDDPAGQPLQKVREIRDDIRHRVERMLTELEVTSPR